MQYVHSVGFFVDILDKAEPQATFRYYTQSDGKAVAADQGGFVVDLDAGEYEVVARLVEAGKAEAETGQILVAGVFEVILINGVVDKALEIAFVVADVQSEFEIAGFGGHIFLCRKT